MKKRIKKKHEIQKKGHNQEKEHDAHPSKKHETEKREHHSSNDQSRKHEKGTKDDRHHGKDKKHEKSPKDDKDKSQESAYQSTTLSAVPLTIPIWSTFGLMLVALTFVVVFVVGMYGFKRLKTRHYDYEEVRELDCDRLLYV